MIIKSECICNNTDLSYFDEYIHYQNENTFKDYEGIIIGKCINCGIYKTFHSSANLKFNPKNTHIDVYENQIDKFTNIFKPIVHKIKKYIHSGSVLDVGCATGLMLSLLKKEGYKVSGIEPNKNAYLIAKSRFGKSVHHGTLISYINNYKNKFDCVIYNHVLEHIVDIDIEMKLIKKILNRNGILIIGVPNTSNIIFFLRNKFWEYLMPNEHIWHFGRKQLRLLLQKYNFQIIDESYSNDIRQDYPIHKRLYFLILIVFNNMFNTGESQLVLSRNL